MSSPSRFFSTVDTSHWPAAEAQSWSISVFPLLERLLDAASVLVAVFLAHFLTQLWYPVAYSWSVVLACSAGFPLLFVFLLERHGGYGACVSLLAIRESERILRVTVQAFSIGVVVAYLCHVSVSALTLGLAPVLVPLALIAQKLRLNRLLRQRRGKGRGFRRAVVLGTGSAARRIYTTLLRSPKFGVEPVAFVEEGSQDAPAEIYECSYHREHSAQVLSGPVSPELFRRLGASVLVVTDAWLDRASLLKTTAQLSEAGVRTYFAPDEFLEPGYWLEYSELDGIMLAHLSRGSSRVLYDFGKRALDLALALVLLAGLLVIAPFVAALIRLSSGGPVFFWQERVGKDGRLFRLYKFRTMYASSARYDYSPKLDRDPRVTPIGHLLRRSCLDELPQAINVLLGQMSIVGPRPEMPFLVEQHTAVHQERLSVKPGITGLWQISGDRARQIHESPEYDRYYVRHRSLFMDAAIILHTFLHLLNAFSARK
jgi:exopolysaccharide biosynthesis polyprenyl glycosylphosphotransferase